MTEYLKDLQGLPEISARDSRGEKTRTGFSAPRHPPINLGPYDNPLLWNKLDPFGADRGHQRRPLTVSRDFMELNQVPIVFRDQCVHRWIPFHRCMKNLKPVTWGTTNCHEFEESWMVCRAFETYRMQLLKKKFMDLTKDYTAEDKKFFPSMMYLGFPYYLASFYWSIAASQRLSGWDERDPANPVMWKEPNRSLMRAEFNPTNWEKGSMTSAYGHKIIPDSIVFEEMPGFPLPEDKRPREE